ncbi:MAG: class I SAM-dependent methyltransferase [Cryomorphaceae bacterium]
MNRLKDGSEGMGTQEFWEHHKSEKYSEGNSIANRLVSNFFHGVIELVEITKQDAQSYLEVGCGPGESSLRINRALEGKQFEVSEFDERFIEMFERTDFPLTFKQESVYEMDREDNSFDCILLLEVLEHLDDYELALKELVRVSNKYVLISVPNEPYWRILNMVRFKYVSNLGNTPGHVNNWTTNGLKRLLSRYGTILKMKTPLPWQMVLLDVRSKG